MKHYLNTRFLILLILCLCCCGCYSSDFTYYKKYRVMTENDYKATQLIRVLQADGVQTFLSGDYTRNGTIRLFIAGDNIFNQNSANFKARAFSVLDKVVLLLGLYDEEVVEVRGSAGRISSGTVYGRSLALARAHQVVKYLWSQDIDASFVYVDDKFAQVDFIEIIFKKYKQF